MGKSDVLYKDSFVHWLFRVKDEVKDGVNDDMLRCMIRAEHRKMVQNSMLFRNENAKSDAEMHRFRAKSIRKLHILERFQHYP